MGPFSQNMGCRLEILGILICSSSGLQCTSKLEYFNFANWFHLWIVFFSLARWPVWPIQSLQVWAPPGAEIQGEGKKADWTGKAPSTLRFGIFTQLQHLPPLYCCVIFHSLISNEVMVSAFQLACVNRSSVWADAQQNPALNLLLCWTVFQSDTPGMRRWNRVTLLSVRASPFGVTLLASGNCPEGKPATLLPYQSSLAQFSSAKSVLDAAEEHKQSCPTS